MCGSMKNGHLRVIHTGIQAVIGKHLHDLVITGEKDIGNMADMARCGFRVVGMVVTTGVTDVTGTAEINKRPVYIIDNRISSCTVLPMAEQFFCKKDKRVMGQFENQHSNYAVMLRNSLSRLFRESIYFICMVRFFFRQNDD